MQGYMTILSEAWEIGQFDNPNNCPTHVFLQVGVGSFSGGLSGFLVNQMKKMNVNIKIILAEPREADCVYRWVLWKICPKEGACKLPVPKWSDQDGAL